MTIEEVILETVIDKIVTNGFITTRLMMVKSHINV